MLKNKNLIVSIVPGVPLIFISSQWAKAMKWACMHVCFYSCIFLYIFREAQSHDFIPDPPLPTQHG